MMLLGAVERQAVLYMPLGRGKGARVGRGGPQRMVGLEQQRGVAALLGHRQEVLA
jgi:hypothetical protein